MLARPLVAPSLPARARSAVCTRAAVADLPRATIRLEDAPACPCVEAIFAAKKDKCVHPTRPIKDACPDCPRRKGKGVVAVQEASVGLSREFLEVFAAKDKCVHPARPMKDACPDCPRRKGKKSFTAAAQEDTVRPCAALEVFAAKDKCVHPGRPMKDACPDCPRRKGKGMVALVEQETVPEVSAVVAKGPVKCVHPHKPESASCRDCPRRKTKWGVAVLEGAPAVQAPRLNMRAMAAKTKCVHPTRPLKDACPDCPRRCK